MTRDRPKSETDGTDKPEAKEQKLHAHKKRASDEKVHRRQKDKTRGKAGPEPEKEPDLQDQLLRLRADFENFRKRTIREKNEIHRRACENIVTELLPVADDLELGLKAATNHGADETFLEGYRMVSEQLMSALGKFGLKPIEVKAKELDPNIHEAVANVPSKEHPEGIIISEIRKGYILGDKLLRAARVAVSSGPPADKTEEREKDDRFPTDVDECI